MVLKGWQLVMALYKLWFPLLSLDDIKLVPQAPELFSNLLYYWVHYSVVVNIFMLNNLIINVYYFFYSL
jgi:hypothetical protein